MDNGNQTAMGRCRFLSEDYFHKLYDAFIEAFSDYVFPFALTEEQFRNHITLNAVDLSRTVGCIENDKIVGFSLNGFGDWEGRATVYDAGTGVIPGHRRQGLSDAMFEMMLPVFREAGISQCLLEVVTTNTAAIGLYEKLGYRAGRELALLQCDGAVKGISNDAVEIREITEPDWELFKTFWDGRPSWQNSVDAMIRSRKMKTIFGAFDDGRCVGYIVFSSKYGRVAQLAVAASHRRRGIGTALVNAMHEITADGFSMQIINIDKSLIEPMNFFLNRGFYERVSQYEMMKAI